MALDRQAQPGHRCDGRGMSGHRQADFVRADCTARCLHAGDGAAGVTKEALDLAVLNDVDPKVGSAAGITPDDRVVPGMQRGG